MMEATFKHQLQKTSGQVRLGALEAVYSGKSGHPGGSLSVADILTYLYFAEMRVDPQNPQWPERDRFVLSKGHTCPALYAALALKGFFPLDELKKFRHPGAMLQGHPDMKHIPGVDMSTGSLGQGLSAACGMALAGKLEQKSYRVYAVAGDGEIQEGQIWEAAMFAGHQKLDNLCLVVDNNGLQIDGRVNEICSPYPIAEKFAAFGFRTLEVDGHDFEALADAFEQAKRTKGQPTVIVAKTIKGKDVSFMSDNVAWHGAAPNEDQYKTAVADIEKVLAGLK